MISGRINVRHLAGLINVVFIIHYNPVKILNFCFMATIPHDKSLDNTISFLKNGYDFIHKKREENHTNLLTVRLMGMNVVCLGGEEGARLFYNPQLFQRTGAVPKRVQKTLTGVDAIHTLDGEKHHQRKEMFLSLMSQQSIERLMDCMRMQWKSFIKKWERMCEVKLFTEVQQLTCIAVCQWAGVPLAETEVEHRAQDFTAMIDAFGAVGPRHWRGKAARSRTEEWIMYVIEQLRNGKLIAEEGTPAAVIGFHKEENGEMLDTNMAAIELINILRPTVAISYYITFGAVALYQHPDCIRELEEKNAEYLEWFVQEVRRFYPFAPFMGALVREDFEWQGYKFEKGKTVLLDIYGTNHDGQLWQRPEEFLPERFNNRQENEFNFIPQGGGDVHSGHRCPGERITVETTKIAVDFLVNHMLYDVPPQDLSHSLQRMPTFPESGFIINNIKAKDR